MIVRCFTPFILLDGDSIAMLIKGLRKLQKDISRNNNRIYIYGILGFGTQLDLWCYWLLVDVDVAKFAEREGDTGLYSAYAERNSRFTVVIEGHLLHSSRGNRV